MKPKLAFFSLACCEGCQLQVLSLEDEILDILGAVEIVNFREAIDDRREDYDIAFIEGSVTRPYDADEVRHIRSKAKVVVAIGACATTGGVNQLKNHHDLRKTREYVYGSDWAKFDTFATRPVHDVIPVDYELNGCPIFKEEFLELTKSVLAGRKFVPKNYPVCVECKMAENECLYMKGQRCLGVVIRAGCGARCPERGYRCIGCRGLIDNPNVNAAKDVLEQAGLTVDDVLRDLDLFNTYSEAVR